MPAATARGTTRHDASGLRAARAHVADLVFDDRAAPMAPALCFLCAKEMTPIIWWPAFGAPLLIRIALSALGASCDCACYDQASCIGAADGPCARCAPFLTIGRLLWPCLVLFVCEGNGTDYLVACFWCSFADSGCAFCAGCQLRLRMPRSGMMHRGCGRPVRTSRTFCDDRAAPMAPALQIALFVCEGSDTGDYLDCFWCSFADSGCAFCDG